MMHKKMSEANKNISLTLVSDGSLVTNLLHKTTSNKGRNYTKAPRINTFYKAKNVCKVGPFLMMEYTPPWKRNKKAPKDRNIEFYFDLQ